MLKQNNEGYISHLDEVVDYHRFLSMIMKMENPDEVLLLNIKSDNAGIRCHCELYLEYLRDKKLLHELIAEEVNNTVLNCSREM